jgi:carbon monoxide dehydrogenase subunit G
VILTTSFSVQLPIDEAWVVLQDMERVARWFPGGKLESVAGDEFKGTVRVKLGPIIVDYRGSARFVDRDEQAYRVVLEASGREKRGTGTAKATAVTQLKATESGTDVEVSMDVDITGRPAQLGQGLMQEVAQRLVSEFSSRMEADLRISQNGAADASVSASQGESPASAATPRTTTDDDEVLDLGRIAGPAMLKRVAPQIIGALVALVVLRLLFRRSR